MDAQIWWQWTRFQNPGTVAEVDGAGLGPDGSPNVAFVNLTGNNRFESGQVIFRSAAETITVSFEADAESNAAEECQFLGKVAVGRRCRGRPSWCQNRIRG